MAVEVMQCPHSQSREVVKYGTASNGKGRYRCQQGAACGRTFIHHYTYPGCVPEVKRQSMQWTKRGAYLLLQARVKTLNHELGSAFCRWYPAFRVEEPAFAA